MTWREKGEGVVKTGRGKASWTAKGQGDMEREGGAVTWRGRGQGVTHVSWEEKGKMSIKEHTGNIGSIPNKFSAKYNRSYNQ